LSTRATKATAIRMSGQVYDINKRYELSAGCAFESAHLARNRNCRLKVIC
jgi:hypothetical protein